MKKIITAALIIFAMNVSASEMEEKIKLGFAHITSTDKDKFTQAEKFFLGAPDGFRSSLVKMYKEESKALIPSLPQKIDPNTTADSVLIDEKGVLISYTIYPDESIHKLVKSGILSKELKNISINQLCSMPRSALYLLYGNHITRLYAYGDGSVIDEITINWNHCRLRAGA